ncbi:hypothetical protein BKA93DRAFT_818245 [Sparassis latifolia]|uniref:Uncharacterized protein n=1 Tax=Sparassis crispa TaxID=139825 RepID=A0A401GPN2_9APHY|nr:hypothetical protein SCP_0600980 [Sparassis crispa]GBE84120.1 hypothetical protein SCP_0600980 [Sparassis crispa]
MAPHTTTSDSSDDDETPETFSFGLSKKAAKGAQDALQQFAATEKQKRKEKNRERDRVLKERAARAKVKSGGKGKGKVVVKEKAPRVDQEVSDEDGDEAGRDDLRARMDRAMREAEEEGSDALTENGEDMSGEEGSAISDDEEEDSEKDDEDEEMERTRVYADGDSKDEGENEAEDGDDEMGAEESDDDAPSPRKNSAHHDYLPDHLFKSAFAAAAHSRSQPKVPTSSATKSQKRKRVKRSSKEIVLGSRTIRTLPSTSGAILSTAHRRLVPPARVNEFVKRSLNLKGRAADMKIKGWARRAANVGVMKRDGPAARFVRSR